MKTNKNKNISEESVENNPEMAIPYRNIFWIVGGLLLMALGYLLLVGGGSDDPNVFREDAIFSFRRMVISPIIITAGFVAEAVAIMYISKKK